jgi:hypothetical protein
MAMTKLEKAVRENEWRGFCYCLSDYNCSLPTCIACHEHQEEGHAADCWLASLLGEPTNTPKMPDEPIARAAGIKPGPHNGPIYRYS